MLKKLMKLKNKKGFTLVELIVVIAIMAVLTAVLVPLVGRYAAQATYSGLQDTAKTISNNVNYVLTDFTQTGKVYSNVVITGHKTSSSAGGLGLSATATALASMSDTGDDYVVMPLTSTTYSGDYGELLTEIENALIADLANDAYFRIAVGDSAVVGVIYSTAADSAVTSLTKGSVSATDTSGASTIHPASGFDNAYEYGSNPIGVSGIYIPVTTTTTSAATS